MTSIWSWLNGIGVTILVFSCLTFAIIFTIKYFKTKVKMYPFNAGIGYCMAIGFSGIMISFIWMLLGHDANEVTHITNFLSYSAEGVGFWLAMYITWDTFFDPKYKKSALIILAILAVIYYIIVYAFMSTMVYTQPAEPGEILDDTLTYFSLAWWMGATLFVLIFILYVGSVYRIRTKTSGVVRKKATYLVIGFSLTTSGIMFDILWITPFIFIVRFWIAAAWIFWYKGM